MKLGGTTDTAGLFVNIAEYNADVPDEVPWAAFPLAYFGGVTLLAGIWKGGKSTLISQLQRAREEGGVFLGQPVAAGPTILVTEEGGLPVKRKTLGMTKMLILDKRAATTAGLDFIKVVKAIRVQCMRDAVAILPDENPPMIFIDTLAVWGDIDDENDASEMTLVIGALAELAQATSAAVILVHHVRKEGGAHGRGIRGSSAIASTVDTFAVMDYPESGAVTDRTLKLEGRMIEPTDLRLSYNPKDGYQLTETFDPAEIEQWLENVPLVGQGEGYTRATLADLWDIGQTSARRRIDKLVNLGRMKPVWDKYSGSTQKSFRYWAIAPLGASIVRLVDPEDED